MDIRKISDQFFAAPQISETDLAALKERGIRSIICNRPDGEGADQPPFEELARTAGRLGLEMRHIPVSGGEFQDAKVMEFDTALKALPKPTLAYCRTGTRSATLWSLAQVRDMPLADILNATKAAGYDLDEVVHRIANHAKTSVDQAIPPNDKVVFEGGNR